MSQNWRRYTYLSFTFLYSPNNFCFSLSKNHVSFSLFRDTLDNTFWSHGNGHLKAPIKEECKMDHKQLNAQKNLEKLVGGGSKVFLKVTRE
jgi:hypothetical protein